MSRAAHLDIEVTSSGVRSADKDLKQLTATAKATELQQKRLADIFAEVATAEENEAKKLVAAAARKAEAEVQAASKIAAQLERQTQATARRIARENEMWNDALQKAIARDEKRAVAAERASKREAVAWEKAAHAARMRVESSKFRVDQSAPGIGAGILQGAGGSMLMGGTAGVAAMATSELIQGVTSIGRAMLESTRQFDQLNAALLTVTGSSKDAKEAFAGLQEFAMTTPYSLRQVVDAFVQLRNLGLNATGRELKAFGDMAAAFGDSMDHMILAVADAAMGINRPLKHFGVLAEMSRQSTSKLTDEGKKVTFTFRGVSTEVEQSATAIEEYLVKLSEANFADAMINRMNTLDGAISNLGDGFDKLVLSITQSGLESGVARIVNEITDSLGNASVWVTKYASDIQKAAQLISNLALNSPFAPTSSVGAISPIMELLSIGGKYRPEQKVITDEDQKEALAALDKYKADQQKLLDEKNLAELRQLIKHLKTKRELIDEEHEHALRLIGTGVTGNSDLDLELMAKANNKYSAALEELNKTNKPKAKEFLLYSANEEAELAYRDRVARENERAYTAARDTVMRIGNAEKAGYESRKQALQDYIDTEIYLGHMVTERQREEVAAALEANEAQWQKYIDSVAEKSAKQQLAVQRRVANLGIGPQSEVQSVNYKYAGQRFELEQALADNLSGKNGDRLKLEAEQTYASKSIAIEKARAQEIAAINRELVAQSLQNAEMIFGGLSTAMKNAHGEQSKEYQTMFAMQQAFGIATATAAMYIDMAKASEAGFPANVPLYLKAAADGAQLIAQLSNLSYSGGYAEGGNIRSGSYGDVGETGSLELVSRPTRVAGPATVIGGQDTAALLGQKSERMVVVIGADQAFKGWLGSTAHQRAMTVFVKQNGPLIRSVLA